MNKDFSIVWKDFMKLVRDNSFDETAFNTWYSRLELINLDTENKILNVSVPAEFIKNYLTNTPAKYNFLKNCIREVVKEDYEIKIFTKDEAGDYKNHRVKTDEVPATFHDESRLNPKYNFKNFIVGSGNEFAHAASLAVAENYENPEIVKSNPLFIYGGSGLGKTHLMQAIGNYVIARDPSKRILYITSEQFTNELIDSIKLNKNEAFRKKYREVDVLLIDDIQFITGKKATQDEFFNTFNELKNNNKQIVLTSDKPPNSIDNIEERLITRFSWGIVVDISPPDLETRIAILKNKCEEDGYDLPNDIIVFIAENARNNIRELEGALSKVKIYTKLISNELSVETVATILKDYYTVPDKKIITSKLIKEYISDEFNVTVSELDSKKRTKAIAYPRQIAMYITRELTELSLPKIGEEFGGRDHSTVIHAYDKIKKDMDNSMEFKLKVQNIINRIKKG